MGKRKSAEQRAEEARRYALARAAREDEDFEAFLNDPNQAIRNEAAANPRASSAVLDRFADDPFWSTRIAVAEHPNTRLDTLLRLLEHVPSRRGVVHHAARKRLEADGLVFDADGMPLQR